MGNEKQHHDDLEHQTHHEEPASTDLADAVADQKAHQGKHAGATRERFGKKALSGPRMVGIITVSASGKGSRIMIAGGQRFGVRPRMEGYIIAGQNMLADFKIDEVKDAVSYADVDAAPDVVAVYQNCVINTSTRPPAAKDADCRIIGHAIEGDKAKLMIASGATLGVRKGMKGYLHGPDGALVDSQFVIDSVSDRTCFAYVKFHGSDVLHKAKAMINPTSAPQAKPSPTVDHAKTST